jgi:hypothetical protein
LQYVAGVYRVALPDIRTAPDDVKAELRLRLQEIALTVASIPREHSFWSKAANHDLQIDVAGWRFFYRVNATDRQIDVVRGVPRVIV